MIDKNLRYTVVGLGATGRSCVDFLLKHNCQVSVVESKLDLPNLAEFKQKYSDISLTLGSLTIPPDTDVILLSPGISPQTTEILAAQSHGALVICDIELFVREVTTPIVAITGTNGKSTVVTLISKMIEASGFKVGLGGNIGVPALSLLEDNYDYYVLELSSFQLETTYSLHAKVASILNVTEDHLDRHGSMQAYVTAKQKIYQNCDRIISNSDDAYTYPVANQVSSASFGLSAPSFGNFGVVNATNGIPYLVQGVNKDGELYEFLLPISELKLIGQQNVLNALAALALADALKLPLTNCLQVLRTFTGMPHRCELLGTFEDIKWINDSKGTNVGASVAAIEGIAAQISGKLIIILGGISKGADLTPLVKPVLTNCKAVILIGEAKTELNQLFSGKIACYLADNLTECVEIARECATAGDGVLLSPACASLDMFANFAARGEAFKQAIFASLEFYATTK